MEGEKYNRMGNQQGMVYQSAPDDKNREMYSANSPHQIGMNLDVAGAAAGHPMKQVLGAAIAGNEAWMAPEINTQGAYVQGNNPGGFALGSGKFDSDSSPFDNSAMKNYLNYLAYRR